MKKRRTSLVAKSLCHHFSPPLINRWISSVFHRTLQVSLLYKQKKRTWKLIYKKLLYNNGWLLWTWSLFPRKDLCPFSCGWWWIHNVSSLCINIKWRVKRETRERLLLLLLPTHLPQISHFCFLVFFLPDFKICIFSALVNQTRRSPKSTKTTDSLNISWIYSICTFLFCSIIFKRYKGALSFCSLW